MRANPPSGHFDTNLPSRQVGAILGSIVVIGALLRVYRIPQWFNYFNDYDEGAWALSARFLADGMLPYKDFMLVHPPLHPTLLGGVYSLLGYDFYLGRYVSAFLGIVTILLAYYVGRNRYGPLSGLFGAALFAVMPNLVYVGRRIVQEPLGLVFVTLAIVVLFVPDEDGITTRPKLLAIAGACFGLAVATKYIFIPTAAGAFGGYVMTQIDDSFWERTRTLGKRTTWLWYLFASGTTFFVYMIVISVFNIALPIPILQAMYFEPAHVIVLLGIFVIPAVLLAVAAGVSKASLQRMGQAMSDVLTSQRPWLLAGGGVGAFLIVSAPFLISAPAGFLEQTLLQQLNRPSSQFPSYLAMARLTVSNLLLGNLIGLYALPALSAPFLMVALFRRDVTSDFVQFLITALAISLLFTQWLFFVQRYYMGVYVFIIFGLVAFLQPRLPQPTDFLQRSPIERLERLVRDRRTLVPGILIVVLLIASVPIPFTYMGYDIQNDLDAGEKATYTKVVGFLEANDAERVYAFSPTTPALSRGFDSIHRFDTFGHLFLSNDTPRAHATAVLEPQPDYIVIGPWTRSWTGAWASDLQATVSEVRSRSRLVTVIGGPDGSFEIYRPTTNSTLIFNERFVAGGSQDAIVGWQSVTFGSAGDDQRVRGATSAFRSMATLQISQDGEGPADREWSHAGIEQTISFPSDPLGACVQTNATTTRSSTPTLETGAVFTDGTNRLIFGLSAETSEPERYSRDNWRLVVLPVEHTRWSEVSLDVASHWREAGWQQPDELKTSWYVAAHNDNPGNYTLAVSSFGPDATCAG